MWRNFRKNSSLKGACLVVVHRVRRRLRVVWSSTDSLVALQTQSGSAESGEGGTLELRCCDISSDCSLASFIGCCHESVTRSSSKLVGAVRVGEHHWLLSLSEASSFFSVLVTRTSSPYSSWRGMRGSSILMICPTHRSWALMSKVSMLVHSARSRTSRFVVRSCQHIPSMERRARMWKVSSCLTRLGVCL